MDKNKFCIKPFNSIHIGTKGNIKTCCVIKPLKSEFTGEKKFNLQYNSIQDFWQSDYRKYLLNSFIDGKKIKECDACWNDEKKGTKSMRQFTNREYGIIGNKKPLQYLSLLNKVDMLHPEDYNLDITNLCNLKCYMCTGESSSRLLVENKALGIEDLNQKDYDHDEESLNYLIQQIIQNKVRSITLQGGEPLINPKILTMLEKLSEQETAGKITVWITTNGTGYSDKIFQILEKFDKIKLIFSIDGTDKINDYLRFPSDFKTIESNVKEYIKLKNATFMLAYTVQNFNLLYIKDIIDFTIKYNIYLKLNILHTPTYLHHSVLPVKTKKEALKRLYQIEKEKLIHVTNFDSLISQVETCLHDDISRELDFFKSIISKRDNHRQVRISNFLPELASDLNI